MNSRQLFLNHIAQTSPAPLGLEIAASAGIHLIDPNGKKYLDLISGIGPSIAGHNHPEIVKAIQNQASRYLHTLVYGEFVLDPQTALADRLVALLPAKLDNIYYLSTGTEATEVAMKLAKRYTGRSRIASVEYSYHGSTQGALSLMSEKYFTGPFRPLISGIDFIRWNDINSLQRITEETGALIMEVVKAETGVHLPDSDFLLAVRRRCNETGTLLVFDEIQSAYARTGSLFAFEKFGVIPDVLLLGKSFGGGMPLAACISSKEIMQSLSDNPVLGHITTFGGHPVCCAAGLAVLDLILHSNWIQEVSTKEQLFKSLLKHPSILAIRSAGLWLAIELATAEDLQRAIRKCLDRGLIVDWFLFNDRAMRIAPPICITEEEISYACSIILESLSDI
jgi:acetylornithine/N-succinyldiaminopimelate aminotransferase